MLIEIPAEHCIPDPFLELIAQVNGNSPGIDELRKGIYSIGHFGGTGFLEEFEHYPEFSVPGDDRFLDDRRNCYGVCDNIDQILKVFPELEKSDREFVVTVSKVERANQSPTGGWRWHKWGPYIGTHTPQHEYIYDEEGIDVVLCYHIYERVNYVGMTTDQLMEAYQRKFYTKFDPASHYWRGESPHALREGLLKAFKAL